MPQKGEPHSMLTVNLTFDYEVFFSSNRASYDEILFEPTEQIMSILDRYNVKGTFFIDVLSYFSMLDAGHFEYTKRFRSQCIEMLKRGHNPQLHIHAHWLDSKYSPALKRWSNDYKKYRLQDYSPIEIEDAISKGVKFLNDCAKEAGIAYDCNTFRGGGLILQPEQSLIPVLYKYGIRFDSTIAPDCVSSNEYAEYDYRNCPKTLNWKFNQFSGCRNTASDQAGCLMEIPVATVKNNPFRYMFTFGRIRIANKKPLGVGFIRPHKKGRFLADLKRRLFGYSWVSLDTRSSKVIIRDLKHIYKKYDCKAIDSSVALIGHPKMFGKIHFSNLIDLLDGLAKMKMLTLPKKDAPFSSDVRTEKGNQ